MNQARYIMVGGFLGAGKTTSIAKFAQWLTSRGFRVGLITNDQGTGLVDSALGRSGKFAVEEISGGCFCCRFDSLTDAAAKLTDQTRPDVFLAEPVGSCTDLVATVSYPLQKIYGKQYRVAALSVLLDPIRALRVLGLEPGRKFSENVRYIYLKQLEEAEYIVINKIDTLPADRLELLRKELKQRYPQARIFEQSARVGENLELWFQSVFDSEMATPQFLDIDYQRYGEGEALLGWLNCTVEMEGKDAFDGNQLLKELAEALSETIAATGGEVAHLKMTLTPLGDPYEIGAVNLTREDARPELSHHLLDPIDQGELLLNMRVECAPEFLHQAALEAFKTILTQKHALAFRVTHSEHFRPSMPTPTHRMTSQA